MKRFFLFTAAFFMLFGSSMAQRMDTATKYVYLPAPHSTYEYLQRAKGASTAAWALLSAGTFFMGAGYLIALNQDTYDFMSGNELAGYFSMALGASAVITSVPFFIMAAHYRKKATRLNASFTTSRVPYLQGSSVGLRFVPALTVKISL